MSLLDLDIINGWHFPSKKRLMDFQRPYAFIIPLQMDTSAEVYSKYIMTTVDNLMYFWLGILWFSAVSIIMVNIYTATWEHGERFQLFVIVFNI